MFRLRAYPFKKEDGYEISNYKMIKHKSSITMMEKMFSWYGSRHVL
jgi:hypothetical protein